MKLHSEYHSWFGSRGGFPSKGAHRRSQPLSCGHFCAKGRRFGPHNQHQQQGLDCLAPNDRYVYVAYFSAGLQVYDVSDPRDPYIAGYFIADDPRERRGPLPTTLVHQANDVLVDRRGVIYVSEENSGIFVLTHNAS
jgi:hypothetical protein